MAFVVTYAQVSNLRQQMEKIITERPCKVAHDNARSERARIGWEGCGSSDKARQMIIH